MGKFVTAVLVGMTLVACAEPAELDASEGTRGVQVAETPVPESEPAAALAGTLPERLVEALPQVQHSAVLFPEPSPMPEAETTSETTPEPEEMEPAPVAEPAQVPSLEVLARMPTAYEAQVANVVYAVGHDLNNGMEVDRACVSALRIVQAPDTATYEALVGELAATHPQGALVGPYAVFAPGVTLPTTGQPLTHIAIHLMFDCVGLSETDHSLGGTWGPAVEGERTLESVSEQWVARIRL